jgi:hypothetical protein
VLFTVGDQVKAVLAVSRLDLLVRVQRFEEVFLALHDFGGNRHLAKLAGIPETDDDLRLTLAHPRCEHRLLSGSHYTQKPDIRADRPDFAGLHRELGLEK